MIADLSANYVERQALLCGFATERFIHDYGLDMILWTFTADGVIENSAIFLQLKATDHLKTAGKGRDAVCRVERVDLQRWGREELPVILVLFDAAADVAFWLYVQSYWESQRLSSASRLATHVSVRIPRTNLLNPAAIRQFVVFRDQRAAQTKREAGGHV